MGLNLFDRRTFPLSGLPVLLSGVDPLAFWKSQIDKYGALGLDCQERSGSVANATNTALAVGRDVALNTYADYVAGADWSNPSGEIARHVAPAVETLQQDDILAAGKTYTATVVISNRTAGSVTITDGGAAIAVNGSTVRTITSTGTDFIITPTTDFDGDIDCATTTVKQTGILASTAYPGGTGNPANGTITSATVGQPIGPGGLLAFDHDGTNDFTNVNSPELNSMFNPLLGGVLVYTQVPVVVWTDNTIRVFINRQVDSNNYIRLWKNAANQLQFDYKAGGTAETVVLAVTPTTPFTMRMTWDAAGVGMRAFYNGQQTGSDQAIAGTWVGNFVATSTVNGAQSITPTQPMKGLLALVTDFRAVVSDPDIKKLAQLLGVYSG